MTAVKVFAPYKPFPDAYSRREIALRPRTVSPGVSLGPSRRLTAVKQTLYNPALPTLRRMSMDEVLCKLPEEHTRFSTPCTEAASEAKSSAMSRFSGSRPYDRQGVRFSVHGPVRPHGTDYNFERPRRMLAAVKEGMVHPKPPTYRRMDMDSHLRKMPIEHCRNSTSRAAEDFRSATITLFRPADRPLSGTRITETGRLVQSGDYKPIQSGGMADFLRKAEELNDVRCRTTPAPSTRLEPSEPSSYMPEPYLKYSVDQLKFNNYAKRYLSPRLTSQWRYTLRQEPTVDLRGQRPIPATIYSRYRNAHAQLSNGISANPWR